MDTDVSPDSARVYLDGRYIGVADDFDGFPDYLYLRRGHYRLEFQLEGYETKVVELDARPNTMANIDDKLHKIPGAKQYGSYDTKEPEGGVQRFFGKRSEGVAPESGPGDDEPRWDVDGYSDGRPAPAPESAPAPQSDAPSEWRDRPDSYGSRSGAARPAPAPSTRLTVQAQPPDAAVYLDDRFIGTAEEVAGQLRGVRVSPGRHRVTVSRPGYKEQTVEVEVETGKTGSVEVELER